MRLYTGSDAEREEIFGVSANDPSYYLYDLYQFGDRTGRTQLYGTAPSADAYLDRPN